MPYKKCSKCHETKDYKYFSKAGIRNGRQRYRPRCRDCGKKMYASMSPEKREKLREHHKQWYLENIERIREVQHKYLSLPETREKKKIYDRKYREKNREFLKIKSKKIRERDAVAISKQKQGYYLRNKERIIKRTMSYAKKISQSNTKQGIHYRIVRACRTRVWGILTVKGRKSAKTLELLGCTKDFLKKHLESQFEPWMTWENYGKKSAIRNWDIDHIIPCSKFDMTCPLQQHACFHYSNLQPLEHIKNIKKRDKIL